MKGALSVLLKAHPSMLLGVTLMTPAETGAAISNDPSKAPADKNVDFFIFNPWFSRPRYQARVLPEK